MFKKIICVVFLGFLLGACTTVSTKGYGQRLDTWIGSTEDNLISQWGVPTSSYETAEHKYLKYYRGVWTQWGEFYCDVTMIFTDGVITSWSFKGNNCEAEEIKDK